MYSVNQLATLSGASNRQIEEWNRAGLLPTPTRPPVPGLHGRGPLRFPDPAPRVVQWLKEHRQSIGNVHHTKLWLWLEGYNCVDVDIEQLQADITATGAAVWISLCGSVPTLPASASTSVGEPTMTAIESDIKQGIVDPITRDRGTETGRIAGMMVAAAVDARPRPNGTDTPVALLQALMSIQHRSAGHLPVDGINPVDCPALSELLEALCIPATIERGFDIHHARLLWRMICAFVDENANSCDPQPWGKFGQSFRRKAYSIDPHIALFALAAVGSSFARKEDIGTVARRYVGKAEKRRTSTRQTTRNSPATS